MDSFGWRVFTILAVLSVAALAWRDRKIARLSLSVGTLWALLLVVFPSASVAGDRWYLLCACAELLVIGAALLIRGPASQLFVATSVLLFFLHGVTYYEHVSWHRLTTHSFAYGGLYSESVKGIEALQILVLLWYEGAGRMCILKLGEAMASLKERMPWILKHSSS